VALPRRRARAALRGIAMAQLGDLGARESAAAAPARAFGAREVVARARCVVAEAEDRARLARLEPAGEGARTPRAWRSSGTATG